MHARVVLAPAANAEVAVEVELESRLLRGELDREVLVLLDLGRALELLVLDALVLVQAQQLGLEVLVLLLQVLHRVALRWRETQLRHGVLLLAALVAVEADAVVKAHVALLHRVVVGRELGSLHPLGVGLLRSPRLRVGGGHALQPRLQVVHADLLGRRSGPARVQDKSVGVAARRVELLVAEGAPRVRAEAHLAHRLAVGVVELVVPLAVHAVAAAIRGRSAVGHAGDFLVAALAGTAEVAVLRPRHGLRRPEAGKNAEIVLALVEFLLVAVVEHHLVDGVAAGVDADRCHHAAERLAVERA